MKIKKLSCRLIDLKKKIQALMFKVLKCIYIFESTNIFIYEQFALFLYLSTVLCVFMSYCVIFSSLVVSLTKCINSPSAS